MGEGCELSYATLTAFCRRHGIGKAAPPPAGTYHFLPGQEMQHDTSPHVVEVGGQKRRAQTASLVFCYSRMLFFQIYPTWQRFDCKVFLTDALRYFGGACSVAMIDNSHIVVASGTGANMTPVPEMAAFAEHFDFRWIAHEAGDADRSGRVERPFHFIENNFLAGRKFSDWDDVNRAAVEWCDKVNATYKKHLRAIPRDLFATERPLLKPLPVWIPEPYRLHHRIVDVEGYVSVSTNRYSVPASLLGRQVEVRETKALIDVYVGPRLVASHDRVLEACGKRVTNLVHRPPRVSASARAPGVEETTLLAIAPELDGYVKLLKSRSRGLYVLALRRLLRMVRDYPRAALVAAVADASQFGMVDLERLERMVLKRIATDFFLLSLDPMEQDDE